MWTRREWLKLGMLAGGASLLPFDKAFARRMLRFDDDGGTSGNSPATTPFLQELPIAPVTQPVGMFDSRCATSSNTTFYIVRQREVMHRFHPELPDNPVWGYVADNTPPTTTPGPTFVSRVGQPVVARFVNELPTAPRSFGVPNTTIHRHGGFQESQSDGFPTDFFRPGESHDYCWLSEVAGGDPREAESTLWYHDHLVDFTAQNVYRGLAGFYLSFDDIDSGNELDPNRVALRLPSGDFDIPIAVQDLLFASNGTRVYNAFSHDGFLGDKIALNGAIQPFLRVKQRKYRFRFLNASNARFYEFFMTNGQPFTVIGTDDHLLPHPISVRSFRIAPAERRDIVLDFTSYPVGQELTMENRLRQTSGRGPDGVVSRGTQVLKFVVDGPAPDPSQVPNDLRELPPIDPGSVRTRRFFEFERSDGGWVINDRFFDANRVVASPRLNVPEIWRLKNGGGGWSHPIHIHLESHRVLSRNGRPPAPIEAGRKDTVVLGPDDDVQIYILFRRFSGRYVFHCHNLEHEDMAMMARFDTVA